MSEYVIRLRGHVPSKKNRWSRSAKGGMHIPKEIAAEIDGLILQAKSQWKSSPLESAELRAGFVVRDGRSDLDNKVTAVQDILVKAGVLRNDSIAHLWSLNATAVIAPLMEESVTITLTA